MFGVFKKRNRPSAEDAGAALAEQVLEDIKGRWARFNAGDTVPCLPLVERIEVFARPALARYREYYPVPSPGEGTGFWLMLNMAINGSGTDPAEDVSAVIAQMLKKYDAGR